MRKINKICDLSTIYKKWEEGLEKNKSRHPKFASSKTRTEYYLDVKMQLLKSQNGLCAYTEQSLCNTSILNAKKWSEGKYIEKEIKAKGGAIDHFDEELKSKQKEKHGRKDWLWDNLFFVDSDVNRLKGVKAVDDILKPDAQNYNPFSLLKYDLKNHAFTPKVELPNDIYQRVKTMIETLQLNLVSHLRGDILTEKLNQIFLEERTWDTVKIRAFPTAFKMIRSEFEGKEPELIEFL